MKLAEYLSSKGIKRTDFARDVGIVPGWVTSLCDESGWPSRGVAERIVRVTGGLVTPNDFLGIVEEGETRSDSPEAAE